MCSQGGPQSNACWGPPSTCCDLVGASCSGCALFSVVAAPVQHSALTCATQCHLTP
nr:MAG TPA: hypothetical protein [Caudoviricetes sp.]